MEKKLTKVLAGVVIGFLAIVSVWFLVSFVDVNAHNIGDREYAEWNLFTMTPEARKNTMKATRTVSVKPEKQEVERVKAKKAQNKEKKKESARIRRVKQRTSIKGKYVEYAFEIAGKRNISPELVIAIIERESDGRCLKPNSACDTGLMQINPKWWRKRLKKLGVTNLLDPYQNIVAGVDILHELSKKYSDVYEVLMFYNMGYKGIKLARAGNYSKYARTVVSRARKLEGV